MADDFDSQFDDEDLDEEFDENPVEEDDEEFEEDFDDDFDDQGFEDEEEDDFDDSSDSDDEDFDKPVEEGDVVEVEVEDLGSKGDGIARVDGFVIFVPGGEVDETYDVEITSVGSNFGFAEIQE